MRTVSGSPESDSVLPVQTDTNTEMDKIAAMFGEKIGDMVEDKVKDALGIGDKDEDEKKGGIFSLFGGDDKKEKEKEKDEGGFFSKIFDKDDDHKQKEKKSGFAGLFTEQEGAAEGGTVGGGEESGGGEGQSIGVDDRDLFSDLMDVAKETSTEK